MNRLLFEVKRLIFILFLMSCCFSPEELKARENTIPLIRATITVSSSVKPLFKDGGRLLLHVTKHAGKEPRNGSEIVIGITPDKWSSDLSYTFDSNDEKVLSVGAYSGNEPSGKYYFQVVYKQNIDDAKENIPGNLYSQVVSADFTDDENIHLVLEKAIPETEVIKDKFVKTVEIKSKFLSEFSGHPRYLRASILLPTTYFDNPKTTYPICYRVPGLNGRYDNVNRLLKDADFMAQRSSKDAPQIIYVFLDSRGPYGDTYQVDSENNGPCGKALTEELIPEIESQVRYQPDSKMRYLTGYSTGGWVALALQIFYPDIFDGTWSYSPDPVDFEHFGLINIYEDDNVFYNKYGYLQPGRRTIYGEPTYSMKEWIARENLESRTNDYRISGGQFGAYNAVFGPKGNDGLPSLMFDPVTGKIDHAIAKQWEKYDLKKVLEKNWGEIGARLQGKIWIWTGDMDGLYSNVATRFLKMFLDKTENPKSDAEISFTPMAGHCEEWADEGVLPMIAKKALEKKSGIR